MVVCCLHTQIHGNTPNVLVNMIKNQGTRRGKSMGQVLTRKEDNQSTGMRCVVNFHTF